MSVKISLPRTLQVGANATLALPDLLRSMGLERPFVVTDPYLASSGRAAEITSLLERKGLNVRLFSDTVAEPTVASIMTALASFNEGQHDCVIGFGGGSPIDAAKIIAVIAAHGGEPRDYCVPHVEDRPGLPIIAIPTTAGTGSEATRFTIITDEKNDEKMLCAGLAFLPVAAIVDYTLTMTMPARLTADTGIDALTHAIEAFVSRKANRLADHFALAAMREIAPNLRRAVAEPDNAEARESVMLGATLAGLAFSNSSVALVHGMSRPIGAHFHVPHGLSNAMLLPAITRFSAPADLNRYAQCAIAMGLSVDGEGDQMAVARLLEELEQLNLDLSVPSPAGFGIGRDQWDALLPTMAAQALASGSPQNNPIVPSQDQMIELYNEVWRG